MKKSLAALGLSLMLLSSAAFAVPSLQQVEQSIAQRDWQRADTQLSQVIDAHPDNAHARYLYAQVLDREGRASDALTQLQRAKSLDPQLRFADAARFAQTEARIRADAARVSGSAGNLPPATQAGTLQSSLAPSVAPAERHGPSTGMWVGLGVIVAAIALVLRWTLRRARSAGDGRADDERRAQLKRATDVLNDIRPLKLDAKLSTAPGAPALIGEIDAIETDARTLVEALSNDKRPAPPYRIDELEQRHASVKARVEGRPDPAAQPAAPTSGSGSVYAQEADRMTGAQGQPYPPQPYPQQPPPVVIQQGGGGFGGGMGGLLTGVLLGEAMSGGRDRVVERDVIVDDERRRQGSDPGFDLGRGDDSNWSDGNGGGGVDLGSNDDGWTDDNS
ncbi:tetratricopeptide repeat protein [Burkholderia stagnalis]